MTSIIHQHLNFITTDHEKKHAAIDFQTSTHWPKAMSNDATEHSQDLFRQDVFAWWHQAITSTNVDQSSMRSYGIHLRTI